IVILICIFSACLAAYKRFLRRQYLRIHQDLCKTVRSHLSTISLAIAAEVALALLRQADLITLSGRGSSPYEQKLKDLSSLLHTAQEQAGRLHALAYTHLRSTSNQRQNSSD